MKIEIQGRLVEVDDSFARLSPDEQQRTVNEIAATFQQQPVASKGPARPTFAQAMVPETGAAAFLGSTINSALMGIPEWAARKMGMGETIDATRQQYPKATGAGDIAGMVAPTSLGVRAGGAAVRGVGRMINREGVEQAGESAVLRAVDANKTLWTDSMRRLDDANAAVKISPSPENLRALELAQKDFNTKVKLLNQTQKMAEREAAGSVLSRTTRLGGQTMGGIMGLQTGAGMLGAARTPEAPGAGFQQGAQTAGQAIQQYNPLSAVPGVPQVTQGITNVVPGAAGYGSMLANRAYTSIDEMIREEAARRALQGQ